ncbi:MAG: hypothetical protein CMP16_04035 [Rickettsiales bacterium]|nr:hypothetical protein [Rickettsiales bacterium]|tara:strand:+ start:142 stop:654 length:513 start_codon:yes stop_codon:yes gene_type:complete
MNFVLKYQKYFIILLLSLVLGLIRWSFLEKDFPLLGLSDLQIRAIRIKELSQKTVDSSIDFKLMKEIVSNKAFPIIDARDTESYNEGYIGDAINIDSYLLIENEDEIELGKFYNFLDTLSSNRIVIYCWNPDCDRADFLKAFLIDSKILLEDNIFLYEGGWDEWHSYYEE